MRMQVRKMLTVPNIYEDYYPPLDFEGSKPGMSISAAALVSPESASSMSSSSSGVPLTDSAKAASSDNGRQLHQDSFLNTFKNAQVCNARGSKEL